ncbi:MAG TPA: hypothetical protein VFV64_03480 [Permianibacter sp.]|nr:hypothetical protein [Permianibacter sp.]
MKRFTPSLWSSLSRVAIGQLASHGYLSPSQAARWSPTTATPATTELPRRAPQLAACARAACCA